MNLFIPIELQGLQNLCNQVEVVVRDDAARIAGFIGNARALNRKSQMKNLLAGVIMRKISLIHERGKRRVLSRRILRSG